MNGNIDDSNISGISASKITSGVLDNSTIPKPADHITIFVTPPFYNGNLGGRTGADSKCFNHLDNETVILVNNSCKNVKAVISVDSSDSIRTMVANYNISTNKLLRTRTGKIFTNSFDNLTEDKNGEPQVEISIDGALGPLGKEATTQCIGQVQVLMATGIMVKRVVIGHLLLILLQAILADQPNMIKI